jgi:hypothetical protein
MLPLAVRTGRPSFVTLYFPIFARPERGSVYVAAETLWPSDDKMLNVPTPIATPLLGLGSSRFLWPWHSDIEFLDYWVVGALQRRRSWDSFKAWGCLESPVGSQFGAL